MDRADESGSFPHRGSDALDGAGPDVSYREEAWAAALVRERGSPERAPWLRQTVVGQRAIGQDEPMVIELRAAREPT